MEQELEYLAQIIRERIELLPLSARALVNQRAQEAFDRIQEKLQLPQEGKQP